MKANEFKELMVRAGRGMFFAALRVTGSRADAEDAVQEAMIRLWKNRATLAASENQAGYAAAAARRCALDMVRSRHQVEQLDNAQALAVCPDSFESRDRLNRVLQIIDNLPDTQREVMTLRHIEGLEMEEIQKRLNLTAGNVRVILSRARNAVRKYFEL